jgi:hypothetical protein
MFSPACLFQDIDAIYTTKLKAVLGVGVDTQ